MSSRRRRHGISGRIVYLPCRLFEWLPTCFTMSAMSGVHINQSVLSPAGIQSASIHALWSLMLWVCTGVFVTVLVVLFLALLRGARNQSRHDPVFTSETR